MSEPRTAPEMEADFVEVANQRRFDRRSNDRRALRFRLDPLFAATLIRQIEGDAGYATPQYPVIASAPRGLKLNIRA
jgi:hypothetical protein